MTMKLLPATATGAAYVGAWALNSVNHVDALTLLAGLPSASVDMFATDLPYNVLSLSWDVIIPFEPMWKEVMRTIKPRGAFVTTASQPFTTVLNASNLAMFKYSWVWVKNRPSDKFNAKNKPMDCYEDISVFSMGTTANGSPNKMNYYPQELVKSGKTVRGKTGQRHHGTRPSHKEEYVLEWTNYPRNVLYFPKDDAETEHPTQKPLALYDYLIRTYTQPGDLVVDFCCGSGTTALAARNLNRAFVAGDITPAYVDVARKRLALPFTPPLFTELTA